MSEVGPPRRTSGFAIASIVAAASQAYLPIVAGFVAIVTGHVARRRIRRSSATLRGDRLALAGLVLGYVGVVVAVGLIVWFVHDDLDQTHAEQRHIDRVVAQVRLEQIGTVLGDRSRNDGFDLGNHPERDIALAAQGSSIDLQHAITATLQQAGFTRRGLSSWEQHGGGFLEVSVTPLESSAPSIDLGDDELVRVPKGSAVVLLHFATD